MDASYLSDYFYRGINLVSQGKNSDIKIIKFDNEKQLKSQGFYLIACFQYKNSYHQQKKNVGSKFLYTY